MALPLVRHAARYLAQILGLVLVDDHIAPVVAPLLQEPRDDPPRCRRIGDPRVLRAAVHAPSVVAVDDHPGEDTCTRLRPAPLDPSECSFDAWPEALHDLVPVLKPI